MPVASAPVYEGAPVILISIDTLRSDRLPIYGYAEVSTPTIDTIRAESVLFERAYSPTPMTLPSHVSMLTGSLPASHGVRNNVGYTFDETKSFTLPCYLRTKGYETGAAVSTYVLRSESGIDACFDLYEDSIDPRESDDEIRAQQRSGWETLDKSITWLAPRVNDPLFFFFHIYEPHVPYDPPEPYRSLYRDAYDGEIALADEIIGKFVAELKGLGLWDRAIVILTSDHGEGLGDHGELQHSVLLNRELLQVPLLVKLPGGARGGETVSSPVQLVDLAPSVLELLGYESSLGFDGQAITGMPPPPDRPVFAETLYPRIHLGWSDLASLIRGRYHFIDGPNPELFDLVEDPGELENLIEVERRTLAAMREAIKPFRVPMRPLEAIDSETAKKMAALGYVGSPMDRSGPLPDPKERIGDLETIRVALQSSYEGRTREAETSLRRLVAENPLMVDGWAKLGEVLTRAGDDARAADAYREAVKVAPFPSADLLVDAGRAALRAGRLDESESLAHAALAGVPTRAHDLLARVAIARGRFAEAEEEARLALHDPPRPADLLLLAAVIQKQGRFDETLANLNRIEALSAGSDDGHFRGVAALRADTHARMGDFEKAMSAYRVELEHFPSNLQAWRGLCVLHDIAGDRVGMDRILEEMVEKNPGPAAKLVAAETLDALDDADGAARWRAEAARDR